MPQALKVQHPEKCIGCELCIAEAQRQLKKSGLEQALIRVFKSRQKDSAYLEFQIDLDPHINQLAIEKIKAICPTQVFEVTEAADHEL